VEHRGEAPLLQSILLLENREKNNSRERVEKQFKKEDTIKWQYARRNMATPKILTRDFILCFFCTDLKTGLLEKEMR
jgi:hypothetical protein